MENQKTNPQLNPNLADIETLSTIPGIGPALAGRIVESRPFSSPEDMMRVPGINTKFLKKIKPSLQFEVVESMESSFMVEEELEANEESSEMDLPSDDNVDMLSALVAVPESKELMIVEEQEHEPSNEPQPKTENGTKEKESTPEYLTRSQARWMAFNSGLFAFVLAVALSLGLIASLNGGLRFASASQAGDFAFQLEGLKSQAETISGDVTGLRTRMDNLETLGGRVSSLEEASGDLEGELNALSENLDGFNQQVESLVSKVTGLQEDSTKYQSFLDGLYELLKSFTATEEPNE
jgi:competence protein ComEA